MVSNAKLKMAAIAILGTTVTGYAAPVGGVAIHQTPIDSFHHWSSKELASLIQKPNVSVDLSDHEFFFIDTIMRDRSGLVEVHDRWNDYIVIQKGNGLLAYGGKAVNLKQVSPGEWRGSAMSGGNSILVHAGDLVVIPAGVTHQMRLEAGKPIRYLAFKARQ